MQNLETWHEQRMSDSEAQEVLRILAERQRETEEERGRPSVQDVATLANAPINEVAAALNEVRSRLAAPPVQKKRINWVAPLIGACSVLFLIGILAVALTSTRASRSPDVIPLGPAVKTSDSAASVELAPPADLPPSPN